MANSAVVLYEGRPTERELRLSRIVEFFGVPCVTLEISKLTEVEKSSPEHIVFGSIQTLAAVLEQRTGASDVGPRQATFYAYANEDRVACNRALQSLCGVAALSLQDAPAGDGQVRVSVEPGQMAGPMAGLEITAQLRREDATVVGLAAAQQSRIESLISAGGAPVFLRFQRDGVPIFFCASSHMVDIDETTGPRFYDVKDHFCSVVPLVMFLRFMFPDAAWRPQELGACLIIDDPLLRRRYGACDFAKLRDLMRRHEFTTNIAFIPWNWRRTSAAAAEFFKNESGHFSVSIHGCDHMGAEFGTTSLEVLDNKARLAQSRMRNHEARTGIQHDPIMVFPQGVFSSVCPEVLKRNGFVAAVNTETVPVDPDGARTRIRDVWDVAITTYSGFPIFTRRYAFHGVENFAFDMLLGKPCLIVSHHDFFADGARALIELLEKLRSRNCGLRWRPLGEVIRRACRRRVSGAGVEDIQMYGNELLIDNPTDRAIEVRVGKRENQAGLVSEVLCDGKSVKWSTDVDHLFFSEGISLRSAKRFQVTYREQTNAGMARRSLRYEVSVALRRVLSEFRDNYLSGNRLRNAAVGTKGMLTRADSYMPSTSILHISTSTPSGRHHAPGRAASIGAFRTVREVDPLGDPRWAIFVERHPDASVFHTPEWLQSLLKTYGYRPVVFTTDPPGKPLTNGIVCSQANSWLTGRRLVSLPFSDHCEPLVERGEDLRILLAELEKYQAARWKYVEIRPRSDWTSDTGSRGGFGAGASYFLHTLDLRPSLEELYRGFHEDSVRRKIRRAKQEGLAYEEGRSEEKLLSEFYRLLLLTRRRHQLPPQPLNWFRNLISCLGDRLKIRVALKDGRPIASILTLRHKKTLVYKYGCSDARFHNLGGTALLFWRAIQDAMEAGLEELDFGRSDRDQAGLITFKEHWGAKRSTLTYLRYPAKEFHPAVESYGMRFAKRVFACAPDGVLAIAGRLLYKHIG